MHWADADRPSKPERTLIPSFIVAAFILATACGGPPATDLSETHSPISVTPTATSSAPSASTGANPPKVPSRVVQFPSRLGPELVGRLFGPGRPRAVVLAHQIDNDQTDWFDFARVLASHRFTVLTFNFEAYCGGGGCSRGNASDEESWADIAGAVDYLRDGGAERIGLVGASMGGEASIAAAARLESPVSAVVTLSASMGLAESGPGAARRDVASIGAPKLFVVGRFDADFVNAARAYDRAASEPKRLVLVPFGEHGIDLLRWEAGERTTPLVVGFLERTLR